MDEGKNLVRKGNCTRCHGSELEGTYNIPRLAGQNSKYLKTTLIQYKNKERNNFPPMSSMLNRYSEKEIEIKRYIELNNLYKKVRLLGYKKNPFPYIKQADLFLLSSKFEGLPNVLVEALYLKKFIISTDCPTGPKEILDNGRFGKLVKIGDYKKIAKLIDNFKKTKIVKKKIRDGYKSLKKYN